jgi:putative selenate reductase FAD-binding subunit
MIVEYYRPQSINDALELLSKSHLKTIPLAGGSTISKRVDDIAVVDLQDLPLCYIRNEGETTCVGATTTLDNFLEFNKSNIFFTEPLRIQASKNQRVAGTIGGLMVTANGRSPVLTVLLAMDSKIIAVPNNEEISLEKWLPIRQSWTYGKLITEIYYQQSLGCVFESVGRSPYDQPIICCAIAKWKNGRTRIVFGGFGDHPQLAFDGMYPQNIIGLVKEQISTINDEWASAEYRLDVSEKLAQRLINSLDS